MLDGAAEHAECALELFVLLGEGVREQAFRNVLQRVPQVAFVFGL